MGPGGAGACLRAGANDLGGTLMNESITRAAGALHGQEMRPQAMEALIRSVGREARQRTTLYGTVAPERTSRSFAAAPLLPSIEPPARRFARIARLAEPDDSRYGTCVARRRTGS
jgi:FO synthase